MITHPKYKCDFNAFILLGGATAVITEFLYGLWFSAFTDDKRYRDDGTPNTPKIQGPLFPKKIYICTTSKIKEQLEERKENEKSKKTLLNEKLIDFFKIYGAYKESGMLKKSEVPELEFIVLHKLDKTNSRGPEKIADSVGLSTFELEESVLFELKTIKGFFNSKHSPVPFMFCLTGARSAISQAASTALSIIIGQNDRIFDVQTSTSLFLHNFWFPYPKSDHEKDFLGRCVHVSHFSSDVRVHLTELVVPPLGEILFASDDQAKYREQIAALSVREVYMLSKIQVQVTQKIAELRLGSIDSETLTAEILFTLEDNKTYTVNIGPNWKVLRGYLAYRYYIRNMQVHRSLKTKFKPFTSKDFGHYGFDYLLGSKVELEEQEFHLSRFKYLTTASLYEFIHSNNSRKLKHLRNTKMDLNARDIEEINNVFTKGRTIDKDLAITNYEQELYLKNKLLISPSKSGESNHNRNAGLESRATIKTPPLLNQSYLNEFYKYLETQNIPKNAISPLKIKFNSNNEEKSISDMSYLYASIDYPLEYLQVEDFDSEGNKVTFYLKSESAKAVFSPFKIKPIAN